VKWSSIRNGEKFRNCAVPIERLTLAPAPSDCSIARNALRMALGTDMFAGFGAPYISTGGRTGSPLKFVIVVLVKRLVMDPKWGIRVSLNATARSAMIIEKETKNAVIRRKMCFIGEA